MWPRGSLVTVAVTSCNYITLLEICYGPGNGLCNGPLIHTYTRARTLHPQCLCQASSGPSSAKRPPASLTPWAAPLPPPWVSCPVLFLFRVYPQLCMKGSLPLTYWICDSHLKKKLLYNF